MENQDFLEFSTFAARTHAQIHWAASLSELNKYQELSSQTTLKENSVNACCAKMSSTPFLDYTSLYKRHNEGLNVLHLNMIYFQVRTSMDNLLSWEPVIDYLKIIHCNTSLLKYRRSMFVVTHFIPEAINSHMLCNLFETALSAMCWLVTTTREDLKYKYCTGGKITNQQLSYKTQTVISLASTTQIMLKHFHLSIKMNSICEQTKLSHSTQHQGVINADKPISICYFEESNGIFYDWI